MFLQLQQTLAIYIFINVDNNDSTVGVVKAASIEKAQVANVVVNIDIA
jgi:hypothetical protein